MNGLMKRQHFLRFSQFELLGFNSDSIKMAIAENTKNKLILSTLLFIIIIVVVLIKPSSGVHPNGKCVTKILLVQEHSDSFRLCIYKSLLQ